MVEAIKSTSNATCEDKTVHLNHSLLIAVPALQIRNTLKYIFFCYNKHCLLVYFKSISNTFLQQILRYFPLPITLVTQSKPNYIKKIDHISSCYNYSASHF